MPFSPLGLLLVVAAFVFLVTFVQIGVLTIAFDKLGLSPYSAYLLFLTTLAGSMVNIPLASVKAEGPPAEMRLPKPLRDLLRISRPPFTGRTVIAVNVGGCVTPLAFSVYLLAHNPLNLFQVVGAIAVVAVVSHVFSRPMPGLGIGMPVFIPPVSAALAAVILNPEQSAPLAYIGGTLGVLIGADLLRLKDIRKMGTPLASIGGAGTFDGIFITGIVAVLLA
jgi:uncharacterized membrane protein